MCASSKLATAIGIAAMLLPIGRVGTAAAQPPTADTENRASVEELQQRLDALRNELDAERKALSKRGEQNAGEIERLREQRTVLADRLLAAQIEREQSADRLKSLRDRAGEATVRARQLVNEAASITSSIDSAAEQLRVHLNEVPGSDEARQRLATVSEALNWNPDSVPADSLVGVLEQVLSEFDTAHDQATSVTVRTAEIFTAEGKRETVKLLSLGHVRFAYQTADGERVGLALASPRDASGYRWSEDLGADIESQIRGAIKAVESRSNALVAVPIDPTGRVQPEMINNDPSVVERIRSGGLVMWPLGGLALVAVLLVIERLTVFYGRNGHADRLAAKVMNACSEGQFERALDICRRGRGAVSRVLEACLRRRSLGQRAMEDSIQEQLLHELPRLNRFMGGIATLAAVAPLLGLLGTVTGIIRTFGVIRAFGNANPSLMAGGISEALLTTATGLVIAVPILIVHSVLRGRSERIVADAERHAAMLLMSLVHNPLREGGERPVSNDQPRSGNGRGKSRKPAPKDVTPAASLALEAEEERIG